MLNIQSIWLFFFLLPYWVVVSYCLDCKDSAFMVSKILTSPALTGYGINNLNYSNAKPWVGNTLCDGSGAVSDDVYIEFNFNHEVQLENIVMAGGNVTVGSVSKNCFVKRFVLEYKNSSSNNWIKLTMVTNNKKYNKKFDSYDTGYHNRSVGINGPVTALKIIIKKCKGYPAVNLNLLVCGVCNDLPRKHKQTLQCNNYKSKCTYSCVSGYEKQYPRMDGVKTCSALDNKWSGQNLTCVDINECEMNRTICGVGARCNNAVGNYTCDCRTGYTGDGKTCVDVDECTQRSVTCDYLASCVNTIGSFTCECQTGFARNGNHGACTEYQLHLHVENGERCSQKLAL